MEGVIVHVQRISYRNRLIEVVDKAASRWPSSWIPPHRRDGDDGEVTFTWIYGPRTLSLTATAFCMLYVRSWGATLDAQEVGQFDTGDTFDDHWRWLRSLPPEGQ